MNSEQHQRVGEVFLAAIDLPIERRSRFLDSACQGDGELRRQVESLLRAHDKAGDFISAPAASLVSAFLAPEPDAGTLQGRIGAYEVLSPIGRGGMGEVYLARDTRLDRNVAVKLLRSDLTSNPDAVRRFEQEARAASSLNHPNIVTIYEIGDLGERRFLAMEFVEGRPLTAMIGRRVDAASVAQIGAQLARALAVAHAAGIVHRDIKPENVMVRADGYVKVLDFGVARLLPRPGAAGQGTDTRAGIMLGTPRYMSPEQARGETVLGPSDIFSLGVLLYELATGTHPFESDSAWSMLQAVAGGTPPNPGGALDRVPPALERLLLAMLAAQQGVRPSADQVSLELTRLAAALSDGGHLASPEIRTGQPRHNLPSQRTPLVGRTTELEAVGAMLLDPGIRLLTLTGPGGTGKTRLAVHAAADLAVHFDGGAWFVDLAPIGDPWLVASAVAVAVGVRQSAARLLPSALAEHLRGTTATLLLMDNFEQVAAAASLVRELLDACPTLKVLVTSRSVLHIYGEHEFPVPPLPLPDPGMVPAPGVLMSCASIALFVQRATAVRPDFKLTGKNADAVSDICRRLDGLPLAIELAAARVKILPPAELLTRIERRLEVLTGGARDLPERQQTLRATIKWSYDLLTPSEQMLFRRLAVFAGGCTLEAIEAVCNTNEDLGIDVLEGVAALVDDSLLVQRVADDAEPRFVMLETFRDYGRERLLESGETAAIARAHAAYMVVIAEEGTLDLSPPQREAWLRTCDAEHDNFRTALHHLVAAGDADWALRLGGALFGFWEQRDHVTEGWAALARLLAMPGAEKPTRARARALYGAAVLADLQGEWNTAAALSREGAEIHRQLGDLKGLAATMTAIGLQTQRLGRYAEATSLFGEAVSLYQQLGDSTAVDLARSNMANAATAEGNFELAGSLLTQVAQASGARGDLRGVASALNGLGDVAAAQGKDDDARRFHHESLAKYRQVDDRWGIARVLADLGRIDLRAGDPAAATASCTEALLAFRALGHQRGVARQLESLAQCAGNQGRHDRAIRLASAAAALRLRIGTPARQADREQLDGTLADARARVGEEAFAAAWREGQTASLDRLVGITTAARA